VNGIPGMAVAIVSKDKVYYLKGFGVRRLGKADKITPTTLFQIASLSKPVNATALGILEEKGKLNIQDPVSTYLPNFKMRTTAGQPKVCHLMSHSTGLPNYFNGMIDSHAPRQNIIGRMNKIRPVAAPGKHFAYNNAVYGVVEDVMCRASGKKIGQILKEELFIPLGMTHASVGLQNLMNASNRAYPHVPNRRGKYVPADNYSKAYYNVTAAGGVNASVQDLVPFMQLYLGKPSKIISKNRLEKLTTPFVANKAAVIKNDAKRGAITDTYYCLGWQSMKFGNKKIIYHTGHLKGFRNFMGYVEDDVGIIVLTNAERKHSSKLAMSFFEMYSNSKTSIAKKQKAGQRLAKK
jgi:beta-lactamase class C